MDQATVKKYSDQFADLRQTKYFVFNTENKYWYKDQFKWRLTFRGRDISRYENFTGFPVRSLHCHGGCHPQSHISF